MELWLQHPVSYVSVANIWDDVTLLVNGVVSATSGQPTPKRVELATIDVETAQPAVVALPVTNGAFPYTAIEWMVTISPNGVGTSNVSLSRDEAPPVANGTRRVSTKTLTRNAGAHAGDKRHCR